MMWQITFHQFSIKILSIRQFWGAHIKVKCCIITLVISMKHRPWQTAWVKGEQHGIKVCNFTTELIRTQTRTTPACAWMPNAGLKLVNWGTFRQNVNRSKNFDWRDWIPYISHSSSFHQMTVEWWILIFGSDNNAKILPTTWSAVFYYVSHYSRKHRWNSVNTRNYQCTICDVGWHGVL